MSKRLQVIMADDEYAEIESAAKRDGTTVSQWVRQTLAEARNEKPASTRARKLGVIRAAGEHGHPTGDIEQLLDESTRGYLK